MKYYNLVRLHTANGNMSATMPAQQFKELCADCDVSKMPKGSFLFNCSGQLKPDTLNSVMVAHQF
jgi:hypothetical protein